MIWNHRCTTIVRLLPALFLLALAACGSGSSGDGVTIIVDGIGAPPAVVSTAPAPAATPVALTVTPMATFSAAMDGASLNAASFSLRSAAGAVAGTVDTRGAIATFTPAAPLAPNTVYTATLSTGVRALTGTPLPASQSWSFTTEAQTWTGVRQRGTAGADGARGVALDGAGNLYLAGSTLGALDGNPSAGGEDLFLLRYDRAGALQWSRQFGTVASDAANAVAVDGEGNIYLAGATLGSLPEAPSASAGGSDLFLIKYAADGSRVWVRQLGSAGTDEARGVAVDAGGNIYVAGFTSGLLPGLGNVNAGGEDLFLLKFDPSGALLWVRQFGTVAGDRAEAVAVGSGGGIVVGGATLGTLPDQINAGGSDGLLVAYAADGSRQWVRQFGTVAGDGAQALAADPQGGIYVGGATFGGLDGGLSAGGSDLFVAKYDESGTRLWSRQLGSAGLDTVLGAGAGAAGEIYLAGSTNAGLDGNPAVGGEDLFLVKYDPLGNRQWTAQFGTPGNEQGRAVAVDRGGNAWVGGATTGILPDSLNAGGEDLFLVKYDTTGTRQ